MRLAFTALLLLATPAFAQAPPTLDRLAFMTGDWVQQDGDGATRETWLSPRSGVMAGVGQTYRSGRPADIEFMKIGERDGGLVFTAVLAGQPPTDFKLIPDGKGRIVFENPEHDFPQRVIYWPCETDLCARIEGTVDGKPQGMAWRYRRQP
jgi:hypothetical protein